MLHSRNAIVFLVVVALATLTACGGNPAASSSEGVVVRGTLLGGATASASSSSTAAAALAAITVTVQENPAITATVGTDGTFTLRGLPEGGFHLVFSSGSTTLGTLAFTEVKPNQEITLTVELSGSTIVVVEERRNGIGHGDVEIEGSVGAVLLLNPAGESRFTIDGKTVVTRPGETAIREGNRARTVSDVTVGQRVHVKGTWLPTEPSGQPVLAQEIKLQGDDDGDDSDPKESCMISGGRAGEGIQLEGSVASGSSAGFMMKVQGSRSSGQVQVDTSGASFKCNGFKGTDAECRALVRSGAKIHVSGMLQSCDLTTAMARASEVKVQK